MADLGMFIRVQAEGVNIAQSDLDKIANTADKYDKVSVKATKTTQQLSKEIDDLNRSSAGATRTMGLLEKAVAGFISFAAIKSTVELADNVATLNARMKLATSSMKEYNYVQARLLDTANKAGRPLEEMQNIFIDTAGNLQDMGLSLEDTLTLTDSLTYAFTRNATSAQRSASALAAFDFALNKKTVDVNTWKSISSAIPSLEVDLARVYGKSLSEIQKLGFEGKLTVDMLYSTLLESYDTNKAAAEAMGSSISKGFNEISNNFSALVGEIDSAVGITSGLGKSLELVANNINLLLIPATGFAVTAMVKGFGLAKAAFLSLNAAMLANPMMLAVSGIAMGVATIAMLTKETKESTAQFEELTESVSDVIGKYRELDSIQRKLATKDYASKEKDSLIELESALDQIVGKMTSEAVSNRGFEGRYLRDTFRENAKDIIKSAIDMGESIEDAVNSFAQFEGISKDLSGALAEEIIQLQKASKALQEYQDLLHQLSIEDGTFMGPVRPAFALQESKEYLEMQERITAQVMKQNYEGLEGALLYERSFGALQNITAKEYEALQLRARSVDAQNKLLSQQQSIASALDSINDRYNKIGMNAVQAELYDLKKLGLSDDQLREAEGKLNKIYTAPKVGSMTDAFKDRFVAISQELSALQALNKEMERFGQPSRYNAVSQLTLEFENQSSALYKLNQAQKEALLTQASMLDSQQQLNEIMSLSHEYSQSFDDLYFELETTGMLSKEIERLTFFRGLEQKAKELSIGMSEENIEVLTREIEKLKEYYGIYERVKEEIDNSVAGGIKRGFNQYIDNAKEMSEQIADYVEGTFGHMENALFDFARTSKFEFAEMTKAILEDLSRLLIKIGMVNAAKAALGPDGKSGVLGSILSGLGFYADGGYTGFGAKYEPAGIVHKGEVVFSQADVRRHGGVSAVEQLRLKGYANGGVVGSHQKAAKRGASGDGGIVIQQSWSISYEGENSGGLDEEKIAKLMRETAKDEATKIIRNQKRAGGAL